jgi:hypothetical protein
VNGRYPRWRSAATAVLMLLLALLLTWMLYGAMRDFLVTPLAYIAWLLWRDFVRINEEAALVLIFIVAVLNLVLLLSKAWELPPPVWPKIRIQGPVSGWLDLLPLARQKGFVGQMPIRQLSLLLVNVLEKREQRPRAELWAALRAGTLPLAPEIQEYLQRGKSQRKQRAAVAPGEEHRRHAYVDPEVEALVSFLEQTMEIEDER